MAFHELEIHFGLVDLKECGYINLRSHELQLICNTFTIILLIIIATIFVLNAKEHPGCMLLPFNYHSKPARQFYRLDSYKGNLFKQYYFLLEKLFYSVLFLI